MSQDGTTLLFGLPGLRVVDVGVEGSGGRVVDVVTDEEHELLASACPACGVLSGKVRQRRTTRPRDVPHGDGRVLVRWSKVQYACLEELCPRKAFTETVPQVPAGARVTGRLRRHAAGLVDSGAAVSWVCRRLGLGWPTVHRAYVDLVDGAAVPAVGVAVMPPVRCLGVDETRRGKVRAQWDPRAVNGDGGPGRWVAGELFETNLVCLGSGHGNGNGLLAQLAGRRSADVAAFLLAQPEAWRDGVEVVAIDLSASYRKAVRQALPGATVVADHFHLVRLGNQAVTLCRQRTTRARKGGKRGTNDDMEWIARRALVTARERLEQRRPGRVEQVVELMLAADRTGQLAATYVIKEELRTLCAAARRDGLTRPYEIRRALDRWHFWAEKLGTTPEAQSLIGTVDAWWPEIEAFLRTGVTNSTTEGTNRVIKHTARVACGFRNVENQRRRVASAAARQGGATAC